MTTIENTVLVQPALPGNLAQLAEQINHEHEQAEAAIRSGLVHARDAGRMLAEAKRQLPHGTWLPWLKEHFKGSVRTAQSYMRVADGWDAITKSAADVAHLSLRDGLDTLATDPEEKGDFYTLAAHLNEVCKAAEALRHRIEAVVRDPEVTVEQLLEVQDECDAMAAERTLAQIRADKAFVARYGRQHLNALISAKDDGELRAAIKRAFVEAGEMSNDMEL